MPIDPAFWAGRRVLVTGHTGFKGSWLVLWLSRMGARVIGFAAGTPSSPSLHKLARVTDDVQHVEGDVGNAHAVRDAVAAHEPDIVIHMAAQAFVRRSFREPRETYEVNVMGTVNVLEAVRTNPSVRAVVVVTSDKCYGNREQLRPFVEDDCMGGHDPYSNSRAASSWWPTPMCAPSSPLTPPGRAWPPPGGQRHRRGRLGGGSPDSRHHARRRGRSGDPHPQPRGGASLAARAQPPERLSAAGPGDLGLGRHAGWLELRPSDHDVRPVRWIIERVTELWPGELRWEVDPGPHPHEAGYLALDSTKARTALGWVSAWGLEDALASIVAWHAAVREGADVRAVTLRQIGLFASEAGMS